MNFTQQFRRNVGQIARESLDESLALPAEEVDATLAEPVAAEIEQEVVAPAGDIADAGDAMIEAEGDADTLDNTAAILEQTTEEEGPGADAAGAEMASLTLERIASKYNLKRVTAFSKEGIATADGRRQMTLSLAKEAEDSANTLRGRVTEGFRKIIQWISDLIKSIFDKRTKLAKRAAALQTRVGEIKGVQDKAAKIKVNSALAFKGSVIASGDKVAEVVEALSKFIGGLGEVKTITEDTVKSMSGQSTTSNSQGSGDTDFNPDKLGGYTMTLALDNGKYVVNKESVGEGMEGKEISPLDDNDCKRTIKASRDALEALAKGEADLKAAVAAMNNGVGKLKSLVTGKDGEGKADRGLIFARYSAVSKLSGNISGTSLSVVAAAMGAVEKSLATFKVAAAK